MRSLAIWFAGAVLLYAGCGDAGRVDEAPPAIAAVSGVTDVASLSFPLTAYGLTTEQFISVEKAIALLGADCMRRFGFDWTAPRIPDAPKGMLAGRYGITDAQTAARWGYQPPADHAKAEPPADGGYSTPAAMAVYVGNPGKTHNGLKIPDGGCVGEARLKLGQKSGDRAEADPRVRDRFARWSSCMKQAGFDYANPWAANDDPRWSGDVPAPQETATSVADVRCKRESELIGLWYAVEVAYQNRLIEQNSEALRAEQHAAQDLLRNANAVLSGQ